MSPEEARTLQKGEFLYFPRNPGRTGQFLKLRENGPQIYIVIQEVNKTSNVNCESLERLRENESIEDKLNSWSFAGPDQLRQHLVFQKLCGRLAEVIYSMEATNTDFKAYQYKPVLKMLDTPGKGILIADEVGLGKTIEAGLIWTELRARFDASRLMVICPASLRKKWVQELGDRFQCDASESLGSGNLLDTLKKGTKRNQGFANVCSYQALLPPKKKPQQEEDQSPDSNTSKGSPKEKLHQFIEEQTLEAENCVDLLIIDEAHYLRNRDNKTSKGIRALMEICEHVLLLSATPIHLKSDNLFSLLNMVDEDYFRNIHDFNEMVRANQPIIQAIRSYPQGKLHLQEFQSYITTALENNTFEGNEYLKNALKLSNEERDWAQPKERLELLEPLNKANLFNQYIVRNRKRDVIEERPLRKVHEIFIEPSSIELSFYEKLLDSIYDYSEQIDLNSPGFLLSTPERMFSSSIPATIQNWRALNEKLMIETESEYGLKETDIGPLTLHLTKEFASDEMGEIEVHDSKATRLVECLDQFFKENPDKKIIIFSFFKITLYYLETFLNTRGYSKGCSILTGDQNPQDRWDSIQDFKSNPEKKILLSSEVGAEGIDLQFCNAIVNYDLPWNPMKIEQRIGRIDRIGQKEKVLLIYNFVCDGTIDEKIYNKLWKRIQVFENVLGDVEMLLNNKISELTNSIFSRKLTSEQQDQLISQTAAAIERNIQEQEELEQDAGELVAFYDVITQRISNSKEAGRWVSADDVEFMFKDFFKTNYPGTQFLGQANKPNFYKIQLSPEANDDFRAFMKDNPSSFRPTTFSPEKFSRVQFTNKISSHNSHVGHEEVDQFHPIIRFAIDESKHADKKINPCSHSQLLLKDALETIPDIKSEKTLFYYVERWSFSLMTEIETLRYFIGTLEGKIYDGIQAEILINKATKQTNQVLHAPEISKKLNTLNIYKELKQHAHDLLLEENEKLKIEKITKAKFQLTAIRNNTARKTENMKESIRRYEYEGRDIQVKSIKTKLSNFQKRMAEQIKMIEDKIEDFSPPESGEVCAGLITLI